MGKLINQFTTLLLLEFGSKMSLKGPCVKTLLPRVVLKGGYGNLREMGPGGKSLGHWLIAIEDMGQYQVPFLISVMARR